LFVTRFGHVGQLVLISSAGIWLNPSVAVQDKGDTTGSLIECGLDHSTTAYGMLLRMYETMIKLNPVDLAACKAAWTGYVAPEVERMSTQSYVREKHGQVQVVVRRVQDPDDNAIAVKLATQLKASGITSAELLTEARRQALFGPVQWAHFCAACFAAMLDPDTAARKRVVLRGRSETIFDTYDLDGDGFLDKHEFITMAKGAEYYGEDFDLRAAMAEFKRLDVDLNGMISRKELSMWCMFGVDTGVAVVADRRPAFIKRYCEDAPAEEEELEIEEIS
jgi:hypothetical protein